jgi:hypothetical protein
MIPSVLRHLSCQAYSGLNAFLVKEERRMVRSHGG